MDYQPPVVHSLSAEEEAYIAILTPRELAIHKLAIEKLGSSYFVWKSHGFQAWKETQKKNVSNK